MKRDIELEATLVAKYAVVAPVLDERSRRRWAAAESLAIGYGGDAVVSSATGVARETIRKGRREIARDEAPTDRIRRPGGGRPRIQQDQPGIQAALQALVDPLTRGDPTSPLRWTCKSRAKLAAALTEQGWRVSSTTVGRLLHRLGYRLQSPRKRQEGATHPDRNAQFEHINQTADEHLTAGQPVISVDTKKKELVGNFKNGGREWQPKGTPPAVLVHDFPTDAEGKAIPYGVYDMARNEAWVSVGWDHDTPAFAVASIRHWWHQMGCGAYPEATTLFITADAGGSNGYRLRAWKHELQQLADETGLTIEVSHFPPGTSKWNKIEHRLFCHITANWRGTPLTTYETIVDRIGNVRTATGLRVRAELDAGEYPTGVTVTKEQMDALALVPDAFHGEWNYKLLPRSELKTLYPITVLSGRRRRGVNRPDDVPAGQRTGARPVPGLARTRPLVVPGNSCASLSRRKSITVLSGRRRRGVPAGQRTGARPVGLARTRPLVVPGNSCARMIPLESPVLEIGTPGSESGGRKRAHGSRPAARLRKAPDKSPAPYRQRASSRLYYGSANK